DPGDGPPPVVAARARSTRGSIFTSRMNWGVHMNRRQFSQSISLGAIGAAAVVPAAKAARSEKKEWAREHLKGLGGLVLPSFTPDFKNLDEEAIRHDIRHSIKQG